jgi:hypothetical protein
MFFVGRLVVTDLVFFVDAILEDLLLFCTAKEETAATDYHFAVLAWIAELACFCCSLVVEMAFTLDR